MRGNAYRMQELWSDASRDYAQALVFNSTDIAAYVKRGVSICTPPSLLFDIMRAHSKDVA